MAISKPITMKTYKSGLSHYAAQTLAAALQGNVSFPPQRITVKRNPTSGKYAVLIGGRYSKEWLSVTLPTRYDRQENKNIDFRVKGQ
jgi:hypothetical protein